MAIKKVEAELFLNQLTTYLTFVFNGHILAGNYSFKTI